MKIKTMAFTASIMVPIIGFCLVGQLHASTIFEIKITNLSPNILTPVPFITHNTSFDLFTMGDTASAAVELLAEEGDTTGVRDLAMDGITAGSVLDYQEAFDGGPIFPGAFARTSIEADISHPLLSYLSMLAVSNDAFIGGATEDGAILLFLGGRHVSRRYWLYARNVWDAGTEVNDESALNVPGLGGTGGTPEGSVITRPHPGISGSGDIDTDFNWNTPGGVTAPGSNGGTPNGSVETRPHPGIPGSGDIDNDFNWITSGDALVASIEITPIPEPATIVFLGIGLLGLAGIIRKKIS